VANPVCGGFETDGDVGVETARREVGYLLAVDEIRQRLDDDALAVCEGFGYRAAGFGADLPFVEERARRVDLDHVGGVVGVLALVVETDLDLRQQVLVGYLSALDGLGDVATHGTAAGAGPAASPRVQDDREGGEEPVGREVLVEPHPRRFAGVVGLVVAGPDLSHRPVVGVHPPALLVHFGARLAHRRDITRAGG